MAEIIAAVGLASSILGIIQLTGTVITQGSIYMGDVKSAPKEFRQLLQELVTLNGILSALKTQFDSFQATNNYPQLLALELLDKPEGPLESCKDIVNLVREIIESLNGRLSRCFLGPLRARNIQQCLARLERLKSVLQLALYADQMTLSNEVETYIRIIHKELNEKQQITDSRLKDINRAVEKLLSGLKQLELDNGIVTKGKKREEILRFLSKVNPASNHHTACELHRPGTGKWFIDGEDLKRWQDTPGSFLWLHGILGSGKTILTSAVIEHTISRHACSLDTAVIYFYFDFKDSEKQTTIGMLGSLIYQLLEKLPEIPQEVESFYKIHQPDRHRIENESSRSDIDKLWSLFTIIVSRYFKRLFVILDALDECLGRSTLLSTLDDMIRYKNPLCPCSLLFTSRKEYEIEEMFLRHSVPTVCIGSDDVAGDVKFFVTKSIEEDHKLRNLKPDLRDHIISTLSQQAKGMFRLAKHQLDIIRELRRPKIILEALKSLPQDLDETYERILLGIKSEDDIQLMRRVLKLIIFAVRPMTIEEVAEAAVIVEGIESLDEDARLNDPNSLLTICGGILSLTGRHIGLSHYSVQQYLTSERTRQGRASHFFIAEAEVNIEISKICLTYLGFQDFDIPVAKAEIRNRFEHYPFYCYAAENWFRHAKGEESIDESLTKLATKAFVSYETPKFKSWLRAYILQEIRVFPRGQYIVQEYDILRFLPDFEMPPGPKCAPGADFVHWLSYGAQKPVRFIDRDIEFEEVYHEIEPPMSVPFTFLYGRSSHVETSGYLPAEVLKMV